MFIHRITAAIALAMVLSSAPVSSWAAANEYKFELVSAKPAGAGKNEVSVRLVHVPDGKPVAGAVIFESKTDMGPSGMAEMPGKVTSPKTDENGVYRFQTENGMAGKWALTIAAKVQGETETVKGSIDYTAAK
ncbi:MAG TPA: FixH family protein [Stellaceae bacterium]|nr:FixH family protein [Stellaceae bacterium]